MFAVELGLGLWMASGSLLWFGLILVLGSGSGWAEY